jgi:hypothetical protein
MAQKSVYCSGSIIKSAADKGRLCWTDAERAQVKKGARPEDIVFLNPDDPITDPTNVLGQFGRDMLQVMIATAVVVDGRERRGIGIGVEMAAAATIGTPIIVVVPRNSHYRQDSLGYRGTTVLDYIHPHIASVATHIAEDFESAGRAVGSIPARKKLPAHAPPWLALAVHEYQKNMLPSDFPMLEALERLGIPDKEVSLAGWRE